MAEKRERPVPPVTLELRNERKPAVKAGEHRRDDRSEDLIGEFARMSESLIQLAVDKGTIAVEVLKKSGRQARESYDQSRQSVTPEVEEQDAYAIPPWYVAAGLGSLDRHALCDFLAVFEEASLTNIGRDGIRDLVERWKADSLDSLERHFLQRIRASSERYRADRSRPDAWLRFRIWSHINAAFDLEPSLPLSTRFAGHRCCQVAECASRHYTPALPRQPFSESIAAKVGRQAAQLQRSVEDAFSKDRRTFSQIVRAEAARHVLEALRGERLTEDQRCQLTDYFRQKLDQLPAELHDRSLARAVASGDWATVAALGTGGSLVGLGVAVEVAGFSAFVAAAEASAVIPFLGGQTAVSLLAVAANPLFILAALSAGGYAINHRFKRTVGHQVASGLAVQLALQGVAGSADGLKRFLDDLKSLGNAEIADRRLRIHRERVRSDLGFLPETPGVPRTSLPELGDMRTEDELSKILFPEAHSNGRDALAVSNLTVAEIIFNAVAIDTRVIATANLARVEDIERIFSFGLLARRTESTGGLAQAGAEDRLRGYVAEMIVATRLSDHEVSLAENPSTAGFDLRVDGDRFQVKCYRDGATAIDALDRHFASNPDIPVFLNSEALQAVEHSGRPWADRVFGVEGFDYKHTNRVMEQSLETGVDLLDFRTPVFAIAASAASNIQGWWQAAVPLRDLPLELVLDGTLHGALSIAGGHTAAGMGTLLFGPAGGVILGTAGQALGVLGQARLRRKVDSLLAREWESQVLACCDAFRTRLDEAMRAKIVRLRSKASQVQTPDRKLATWLRLRFGDREACVAEYRAKLFDLPEPAIERTRSLLRIMREAGVHPWSVRQSLKDLEQALSSRPSITDHVTNALEKYIRR